MPCEERQEVVLTLEKIPTPRSSLAQKISDGVSSINRVLRNLAAQKESGGGVAHQSPPDSSSVYDKIRLLNGQAAWTHRPPPW
ncbi:unnamed protein product [Nezara viridula]|uniref:Uncharacterized protein n=1 Tax=Nezara viridula TaxID=85310 RepID=A0A9P0EAC1_NEZVI|nr:unnamed protein product [Nezara viridula]